MFKETPNFPCYTMSSIIVSLSAGGELGVGPQTQFSKRRGLTGPQFLEGGYFFQGKGGCNFYIKNKQKSAWLERQGGGGGG